MNTMIADRVAVVHDEEYDDDALYPESDGLPMSDNTLQFEWIVRIKSNLDIIYYYRPDVFVAGDLLWYPVRYHPEIRRAPDAMTVFGRPKGYRKSYLQWKEDNVPPHVVFEIQSPGNTLQELTEKFDFYEEYGSEEYYLYNPDKNVLSGWLRQGMRLKPIPSMHNWTSPRLQIRFELTDDTLNVYRPDGKLFLMPEEIHLYAEETVQKLDQTLQQNDKLKAKLRALGIDPDTL